VTICTTVPLFVDTSVLVYARDAGEGTKHDRALEWVRHLWSDRSGRVSIQVLEEYYVTVTRKLSPGMPAADARADVRDLFAWRPIPLGPEIVESAWDFESRFRIPFSDASIVAAAKAAHCDRLLSADFADGRDFDGVTVISPFTRAPND
jgi:predicted nucleic acid-binding protein